MAVTDGCMLPPALPHAPRYKWRVPQLYGFALIAPLRLLLTTRALAAHNARAFAANHARACC